MHFPFLLIKEKVGVERKWEKRLWAVSENTCMVITIANFLLLSGSEVAGIHPYLPPSDNLNST